MAFHVCQPFGLPVDLSWVHRCTLCIIFFILKILHEGHTPAAEAASTEGQQQDTATTL
jgi:hypothetical protein